MTKPQKREPFPQKTRDEAVDLAKRLKAYWTGKGATTAEFRIERASAPGAKGFVGFVVRSNLVNGMPPRWTGDEY